MLSPTCSTPSYFGVSETDGELRTFLRHHRESGLLQTLNITKEYSVIFETITFRDVFTYTT